MLNLWKKQQVLWGSDNLQTYLYRYRHKPGVWLVIFVLNKWKVMDVRHRETRSDSDYHLAGSKFQDSTCDTYLRVDIMTSLSPDNYILSVVKEATYILVNVKGALKGMKKEIVKMIFTVYVYSPPVWSPHFGSLEVTEVLELNDGRRITALDPPAIEDLRSIGGR